jgi:flagellar hook-length control protein FliK
MLLNPLFGLTDEPSTSSEPSLIVDDVSGSPFQEILHSVQQAESMESGPSGSGYPSLADLIADVISAETSQNPGLERNPSDQPHQGSATEHKTASEDPIEPGLTNGFTCVSPHLQTPSETAEGPLGLNSEVDPTSQWSTTQTELSFVEATFDSDGKAQPKQSTYHPSPQPNTIGDITQAPYGKPGSGEETDRYGSATVPSSRGLDRDSQWRENQPTESSDEPAARDSSPALGSSSHAPELAQDIATTLSAQQAIQQGGASETVSRVGDLLRSMDGLAERLELQGNASPNTFTATTSGDRQEAGREGLELDDSGLVRQPLAAEASRVDRQEKVDTSRLHDGLNTESGSVKHQPEADVALRNLMPSDRQDVASSTPPESGAIPNIGTIRGNQEPISSLDVSGQPAPPTKVDEPKVTSQIVRGARFLTREGANQVTLRLDPPELGEVTIRLSSSNNTLSGEIRVESRMVQEIVSRNIGELRESLGNQGIRVDNIEVSVESGGRSSVDRDGSAPSQRDRADRDGQSKSDRDRQPQEQNDQRELAELQSTGDGNVDYVA